MEEILKLYDNAEDDGFIGHDNLAREIVDFSSNNHSTYFFPYCSQLISFKLFSFNKFL